MSKVISLTLATLFVYLSWNQNVPANEWSRASNPSIIVAAAESDIVEFNTVSHKYHNPHCTAAIRCTVNCIKITRAEAKKRGGIPCKLCGGGEWG